MKTLRIIRTVYPPFQFSSYNEWSMYFFGMYATEMAKIKEGWDKNIYKPKVK
jgi:hypothetical protein